MSAPINVERRHFEQSARLRPASALPSRIYLPDLLKEHGEISIDSIWKVKGVVAHERLPLDLGSRFSVRRLLGQRGFGMVYEAHDFHRDGLIAIKTLKQLTPENHLGSSVSFARTVLDDSLSCERVRGPGRLVAALCPGIPISVLGSSRCGLLGAFYYATKQFDWEALPNSS